MPAIAQKPVRQSGKLEITRAAYEALSGAGSGDVTERVRAAMLKGTNDPSIRVTNTWNNRLVGDA